MKHGTETTKPYETLEQESLALHTVTGGGHGDTDGKVTGGGHGDTDGKVTGGGHGDTDGKGYWGRTWRHRR